MRNAEKQPARVVTLARSAEERQRYDDGWRMGKPEEDPEKLKRWGLVTAKPSEFLIHMRGGEVRARTTGQGSRCFKLPGDSVAIVPTTVQRLQFTADQVTREKVGVQVTGLAVYRISDPLIAFRMLNFSFPERASEKLEQLLVEMFVGAVRRLVANLAIEECLTQRKEELAEELMREIAPVISGKGRPEDHTEKGWGVVIDTIEIQDVRVSSQTVFANMQARFRKELERQARQSQAEEGARAQAAEVEAARQVALAKVAGEAEVRERRQAEEERAKLAELSMQARLSEMALEQERAASLAQHQRALEQARLEAEVRERQQAEEERAKLAELAMQARLSEAALEQERAASLAQHQRVLEQARLEAETARSRHEAALEQAHLEAEAEAAKHQARLREEQMGLEVWLARAQRAEATRSAEEAELRLEELRLHKAKLAQDLELERRRVEKEIENWISPEAIQLVVAKTLPQLAKAFEQKLGTINVTSIDGANPFGVIAAAVDGVMGLARSAGLSLPKHDEPITRSP